MTEIKLNIDINHVEVPILRDIFFMLKSMEYEGFDTF